MGLVQHWSAALRRSLLGRIPERFQLHDRPFNLIYAPRAVPVLEGKNVAAFLPDPVRGWSACGGTLLKHLKRGHTITLILPEGSFHLEFPSDSNKPKVCEVPAICVMPEGGAEAVNEAAGILSKLIEEEGIDLLYAPSFFEPTTAELIASRILLALESDEGLTCGVAAFESGVPLIPNRVVDLTEVEEEKAIVLSSLHSSTGSDLTIEGLDALRSLHVYRSVMTLQGRARAEAFLCLPGDRYGKYLAAAARGDDCLVEVPRDPHTRALNDFFRFHASVREDRKVETLDRLPGKRILVLSAHVDDDVIGCGASLYLHRQAGEAVTVVYHTDGRQGDPSEPDPDKVVAARKEEARRATAVIGVEDLIFLDEPDTRLQPTRSVVQKVAEIINNRKPDLIYLPGFLDNHIDHFEISRILERVDAQSPLDCRIATCDLWTAGLPNRYVPYTDIVELKKQAIECYESQLRHVDYLTVTLAFGRYRSHTLGGKGYYEAFRLSTASEYLSLFRKLDLHRRRYL